MQLRLLISPWKNEFIDALSQTQRELFISSPFVSLEGVRILSDCLDNKSNLQVSLITNLTVQNIINGATEPAALLELMNQFGHVNISVLGRLHAKVYLIDDKIGIITSANLTGGGLMSNFEYGVLIDDPDIVFTIKEDMLNYYALGNVVDKALLERLNEESQKLCEVRRRTDDLIESSTLARLLKQSTEALQVEMLRNRLKGGRTINAIFSETILYLLEKKGPLTTTELHPLIQSIHPDICDDSIDRIIDGQHFGKKWKHLVRNAQQYLKRKGLVKQQGVKWDLVHRPLNRQIL